MSPEVMMLPLLLLISVAASPAVAVRPVSPGADVFAVYINDWRLGGSPQPAVMLVAWADGYVVRSANTTEGGPPFVAGTMPTGRWQSVVSRVRREGWFGDKNLARPCYGPDSRFMTLLLRSGPDTLRMESWHELFESNPRLVVRSCAVMSANGIGMAAYQDEPPDFQHYRKVWASARQLANTLASESLRPVHGSFVMEHGELAWHEEPAH